MVKLQIIGNLGADATIESINGREYISFRVAHTEKRVDNDGVIHEQTQWVSCIYPNQSAKLASYLTKGTKVFAEGQPRFKTYKATKSGVTGYFVSVDLMVNYVELCGGSRQAQASEPEQPEEQTTIF